MADTVTAGFVVIGDEVLSGRTQDVNVQVLATALGEIGIGLSEVRIIADGHDRIIAAVQALSTQYTYVFTSGGIGPTHDDITAEAVAAAFGQPISIRDDAREVLETHYGDMLNEARLRMARIPDDATLIDNPISVAPGFVIENVHVMAGVPRIFKAMLENVIPTLSGGAQVYSRNVVLSRTEGEIASELAVIAEAHPDVAIGSYPRMTPGGGWAVTVVLRGTDAAALERAATALTGL